MRQTISATLSGGLAFAIVGLASACGNTPAPADAQRAQQEIDERTIAISQQWPQVEEEWSQELVLLDNPVKWLDDSQLTEQQSAAFNSGNFQGDIELPTDVPPDTVEFDGGEAPLDPYDAHAAHRKLTANTSISDDCPRGSEAETLGDEDDSAVGHKAACGVLTITDIELGNDTRWTNHGLVEMPAWMYTVDGADEPISQLAFEAGEPADTVGVDVSDMPKIEEPSKADQLRAVSESTIEFTVATGDCRTNERGVVSETEEVIVVGGIADSTGERHCTLSYRAAPVKATLDSPVADRMIVDASSGEVLTHRGPSPESPSNY